jgi:hypothetical protein
MVLAGILFYITSMTMHKFIMKHPQIKDICDFGYYAFGKSKIAYEFTAIMLLLNNIMLIGFVRVSLCFIWFAKSTLTSPSTSSLVPRSSTHSPTTRCAL